MRNQQPSDGQSLKFHGLISFPRSSPSQALTISDGLLRKIWCFNIWLQKKKKKGSNQSVAWEQAHSTVLNMRDVKLIEGHIIHVPIAADWALSHWPPQLRHCESHLSCLLSATTHNSTKRMSSTANEIRTPSFLNFLQHFAGLQTPPHSSLSYLLETSEEKKQITKRAPESRHLSIPHSFESDHFVPAYIACF